MDRHETKTEGSGSKLSPEDRDKAMREATELYLRLRQVDRLREAWTEGRPR